MSRTVAGATASTSPTLSQYINLADYAYTSGLVAPNPALKTTLHLTRLMSNGKPVQSFDTSTGFYGTAFVTSGPTRQLIIAFQGTNPDPPSDAFGAAQAADDALIVLGQEPPSYQTALTFTQTAMKIAASKGIAKKNDFLVGHSLGGAEAQYVATQTGLAGVTFGGPGIVPAAGSPASRLTNYVEQGDPVGNYASDPPDYLSNQVYSSSIVHYGTTDLVGASYHSDLLQAANIALGEHTDSGDALAAGLLATAADFYHPLGTYASDLGLTLYSEDYTVGSDVPPLCFAEGTRIRTACGDVAVEDLAIGDLAVTSSGAIEPIRWLGRRELDCTMRALPSGSWPVRICPGAFGAGLPERELRLSPGHPVLVRLGGREVLVPIMCLINGTTIERVPVDRVTYWHVELGEHDILLAEGLPAESFLDLGNRPWFGQHEQPGAAHDTLFDPDLVRPGRGTRCRPVMIDGPIVAAERRRLDAVFAMSLAEAADWPDGNRAPLVP